MRKVIAIDFDGCLCEDAWPGIGEINRDVFRAAIEEKRKGAALILWTCREGKMLHEAVDFCAEKGLTFDAVNENLPERVGMYRNDCRKISTDEYWDDKAVRMGTPSKREEIMRDALYTFGFIEQANLAVEKMSGLTTAICKWSRAKTRAQCEETSHRIFEKMVDVQIMLDQLKLLFGKTDDAEWEKLERLKKQVEKEREAQRKRW